MDHPRRRISQGLAASSALAQLDGNDLTAQLSTIQSVDRIYEEHDAMMPTNTQAAYDWRIEEFRQWCLHQGYTGDSCYTVTPEKAAAFIREQVIGRSKRRGGRKAATQAANGADREDEVVAGGAVAQPLGSSSINLYIAAVVKLWELQKRKKINAHPHPRDGPLKELTKSLNRAKTIKRKNDFADRGVGTLLDGHADPMAFVAMSNEGMERGNPEGLRDRAMFLFTHYAMLRGQNARNIELADLWSVELEGEGFGRCMPLVVTLDNGKMNQDGRLEFGGMLRNKDLDRCPIGAFALYCFDRFHIHTASYTPGSTTFPSMTTSREWYNVKAFSFVTGPLKKISYDTHKEAMKRAQKRAGVKSSKVTHFGKGSGARTAELAGGSEDGMRRSGRWEQGAMSRCYLSRLPLETMRVMGGFAAQRGNFHIKRDIDVPDDLVDQIFP